MPYPNEHAARLKDPGQYDRFRRENDAFGPGIHAIWGIKGEGADAAAELQAIRFDKAKFTVAEAKKWLTDHNHHPIAFEPATEEKTMSIKTVKSPLLYRSVEIRQEDIDLDHRSVRLSFSSELPVERFFGMEILDHSPGSMRMNRAKHGLPLLVNHDRNDQVGRAMDISIGTDRRGHAVALFGKSQRAAEIFQDVTDGIRQEVSFGYRVHEMVLESRKDDKDKKQDCYRVTDYEPYEISLETIPADHTVGVGRTEGVNERQFDIRIMYDKSLSKEVRTMRFCPICGKELVSGVCPDGCQVASTQTATVRTVTKTEPGPDLAKMQEEYTRQVTEILAIGEKHKCMDLARKAISDKTPLDEFRKTVLENVYKAKPVDTPDPLIGMSKKDLKDWSIVRAIRAAGDKDWSRAGLEKEASDAVAKIMKKDPQGFYIPYDIMGVSLGDARQLATRDLQKVNWGAGGAVVATEMLSASFIEMLRNKTVVKRLGATVMSGLVGDIAIPKQTATATAYWIAEGNAPTESQQTLGQVGLTPKTCGAFTDYSRKLLNQASIDIEAFVRNDLSSILSIAQDLAAINGSGIAGQPLGILNWPSVNVTAIGANGGAITHAAVVSLETQVMTANADVGTMSYLTGPALYGTMKVTAKTGAILEPIYDLRAGATPLNGYPCAVSTQVPANLAKGTGTNLKALIFGVWSCLLIAEWGTIDILVDPYTGSSAGNVRVRALMDTDINTRYQQAFAVVKDAT